MSEVAALPGGTLVAVGMELNGGVWHTAAWVSPAATGA
jgi:hypothetical protein